MRETVDAAVAILERVDEHEAVSDDRRLDNWMDGAAPSVRAEMIPRHQAVTCSGFGQT